MSFWSQRSKEIETIADRCQRTNHYYRTIEACENHLQAPPFARAAKNSYNHVMDTLLSKSIEIPLYQQKGLTISFDEAGIPAKTRFGFTIRICGQDESRFITDGYISRETSETLLMLMLAEHADCFFDVGANVGYFSLLMCTAGHGGLLGFAFEPRLPVFDRLVRSIQDNGLSQRIQAHHCAVGEKATQAVVTLNRQGSGGNTLCRQQDNRDHSIEQTEKIAVISLDSFIAKEQIQPTCGVLKIDVEGYESKVIDGASEYLSCGRAPIILIETFPSKVFRESHDRSVLARIKRLGYRIYAIEPFRSGFPSLRPAYPWGCFKRCRSGNYLAFPEAQAALEAKCCQPLHEWALISIDRLKRIIDFQENAIAEAESYFHRLVKGQRKKECVFKRWEDV